MRLPFPIFVLGILGATPFPLLGGGIALAGLVISVSVLKAALLAYAGCVLAFSGGVHWGLAMRRPDIITVTGSDPWDRKRAFGGVCPALWACLSLIVGMIDHVRAAFVLEIVGFVGVFLAQRSAWRQGAIPNGYFPLHLVLTVCAISGLCLAALAR